MIDTEALRKKVIDLAIQGKLTEQLPEDGSAEDLYAQIQEEKEKLIKEGKLKKQKPLPEIEEDEIPFEIPKNWKWVRLGKITYIERGGSPRPIKNYLTDSENGINWIKIGDVEKGGKYICSTKERIISEGEKKSRHVYPGDFLLTNSMSFGRPYISKIEGCIHDGWLLVRDIKGINSDYLYFLLSSSYMYKQFCKKAAGAAVDNLNIDRVNSAMMPFPTVSEQNRIVELIESTFKQIDIIDELQNKYNNDVEVLKRKVIDAGIQGKLTEQLPEDGFAEELYQQIQGEKKKLEKEGKIKKEKKAPAINKDELPFEIPDNWKWCRLSEVGTTNIGLTYHPEDVTEDGVVVIRSSNIQNGKMDFSDIVRVSCAIRDNQYLNKDDIVICARNGSKALVGKRAIFEGESNTTSFGAFMAVFRTICYKYVYYFFGTKAFRRYFSSDDSKQINQVTQNILKNAIIPLPPLSEQKRITDILDSVFEI